MEEPQNKVMPKSDHLKPMDFFLCAIAAVGLHILLVVLFCKEQNLPLIPESQDRTTILFSEMDPHFSTVAQKIKAAPDPAEFIRGNRYGYSRYSATGGDGKPELKNNLPPLVRSDEKQTETVSKEELPDERSYAELKKYTAQDLKKQTVPEAVENSHELYPIWRDAFGSINIRNAFDGYNSTIRINSQAVTAPTVLKIQFNPKKKNGTIPVHVSLVQSCGDTFLDHYAKNILQNRITDPAFLKKFNPEYNDKVSIYWQPELKAVDESTFPQNMFPGGDSL